MKKIIIGLCTVMILSFSSKSSFAQDKKVAMLEGIAMTDGISNMVKNMVRGELTKSLSLDPGFSAFTRLDVDQLMKEYNFQESGMVNDEQRVKLGQMSGADYVCISKISKEGDAYYIEACLIHIETGRIDNPGTAFAEGGISSVNAACQKVAANMVGKKIDPNTQAVLSVKKVADTSSKTKKNKTSSVYPKSVQCEAYKISILSLNRVGRTLTMYFKVKNEGRYTTDYKQVNYTGWGFTLYTGEGDVIKASGTPRYDIRSKFHPGMTVKKKVVFNDVPNDIKEFTHLVFKTSADLDQSGNIGGGVIEHSIENLPIEKMSVKSVSKSFFNSLLE